MGEIFGLKFHVSNVRTFHQVWYQGGVKSTVFGVFGDLKSKISEGSDQSWDSQQGGGRKTSILFLALWNF